MMSMTQPIFGRIAFDDPFFQPWHKASVGLDAVLDRLQCTMDRHDEVQRVANTSFPPVNILRNGLKYRIELAVAGFKISDIKIKVEGDTLLVLGEQTETALPELNTTPPSLSWRRRRRATAASTTSAAAPARA